MALQYYIILLEENTKENGKMIKEKVMLKNIVAMEIGMKEK